MFMYEFYEAGNVHGVVTLVYLLIILPSRSWANRKLGLQIRILAGTLLFDCYTFRLRKCNGPIRQLNIPAKCQIKWTRHTYTFN
jgi:hypothetical protein